MNPENNNFVNAQAGTQIDAALRAHFQKVYNVMAIGLVVTGAIAFLVANTPAILGMLYTAQGPTILAYVFMFAPLAFIFFGFTPNRVQRMSPSALNTMFYGFSAMLGISMSSIFLVYSGEDIARVFFITSATFAATSLYGYTTKRDLSAMGSFLIMGVIGIIIASIVNIFLGSSMLQMIISIIGVIAFTGLTAWDTQRIKETFHVSHGTEANLKAATMGALSLYLDFINLFQFLLMLLGNRE